MNLHRVKLVWNKLELNKRTKTGHGKEPNYPRRDIIKWPIQRSAEAPLVSCMSSCEAEIGGKKQCVLV